jgi:hypothetical protein
MLTMTSPEDELKSNRGLEAGTVVTEKRYHPYIDHDTGHWKYKTETLRFEIVEVYRYEYRCRYNGEKDLFFWPFWDKQPNYGFMDDGCSTVRYYAGKGEDSDE